MVDVAQLRVVVSGETTDAEKKLGSVNDKVKASSGFFKDALSNALGYIGGAIGVSSISDAFGLVKDSLVEVVKAGMDANQIDAQLAAGLRSTHDASGMTTDSLNALADKLSGTTGITDDAVKSSESMLLTFTNIGKNVFPQATQAVADLATKMANGAVPSSVQMEQASIQLGKALGDPTKGYAQLQRVGVTFNAQQIEQIKHMQKAGDIAGAQNIILGEMNKEFGGSAAAAGQANGGLAILNASFDNMKEKVGQAIIPILNQLMTAIEPLVQSFANWLPGALAVVSGVLSQLGPVLQSIGTWFSNLFTGISTGKGPMSDMKGLLTPLKDAFVQVGNNLASVVIPAVQQLGHWFQTTLVPAVQALMPHLATLGTILFTQVFPAFVSIWGAVMKVGLVIESALLPVIERLLPIVLQLAGWLADQLGAAFKVIMPSVQQAATTVSQFATQLSQRLGPAINAIMNVIQGVINFILPIWNAVWPSMQTVFAGVWQAVQGVIQVAWSIVSGIIKVGLDLISGNWKQAWADIQDTVAGVWQGIQNIFSGAFTFIVGAVKGFIAGTIALFTGLWDKLVGHSIIPDMVNGIISWFASLPGKALTAIITLASNFTTFFTGLAGQMITAGEAVVQGLINGIKNMVGAAGDAIKNVGSNMLGGLKSLLGIHSPSTVFAEVGHNLGLGLIQGFQGIDVAGAVAQHLSGLQAAVTGSVGLNVTGSGIAPGGPSLLPAVPVGIGGAGVGVASGADALPGATQVIQLYLNSRVLAEAVVKDLPRSVRLATGLKM